MALLFSDGSYTGPISNITYDGSGNATSFDVTLSTGSTRMITVDPTNPGITQVITDAKESGVKVTVNSVSLKAWEFRVAIAGQAPIVRTIEIEAGRMLPLELQCGN